jgi:hypothetical protein
VIAPLEFGEGAVHEDPTLAKDRDAVGEVARELLRDELPELPRLRAIVGDRGYPGPARLAARRHLALDLKAPPKWTSSFVPLPPLVKIEHAFAQLGRWRRLSRCYEGTEATAKAWPEVASGATSLGGPYSDLTSSVFPRCDAVGLG